MLHFFFTVLHYNDNYYFVELGTYIIPRVANSVQNHQNSGFIQCNAAFHLSQ